MAQYDFGMIGIGVMGSNLLLNIADHGFSVIGFDLKQERADKLEAAAKPGTIVKGTTSISEMAASLKTQFTVRNEIDHSKYYAIVNNGKG